MNILRNEVEVTLNDLAIACREAAIHHRTAAEIAGEGELRRALDRLSRSRAREHEEILEILKNLGDTPNAPAHEKEFLDSAVARFKAAISKDERAALLADCQSKEDRIGESARAALRHAEDDALRSRLAKLEENARTSVPALQKKFVST